MTDIHKRTPRKGMLSNSMTSKKLTGIMSFVTSLTSTDYFIKKCTFKKGSTNIQEEARSIRPSIFNTELV